VKESLKVTHSFENGASPQEAQAVMNKFMRDIEVNKVSGGDAIKNASLDELRAAIAEKEAEARTRASLERDSEEDDAEDDDNEDGDPKAGG
jgi:hypothetical protein